MNKIRMKIIENKQSITAKIFNTFVFFMGLFLIGLVFWTETNFGKVTIDQTLSTLDLGFNGAFSADSIFMKRFVLIAVLIPFFITTFYLFLNSKFAFLKRHFLINKVVACLPILLLAIGIVGFINQFQIFNYIKNYFLDPKIDYFQSHYVDTKKINFTAKKPKSLVLIYVESLETTYSDVNLFGHDLLQSLNQLDANKITFKYTQMPGTGWTIAGMISTQCGIPFKMMTVFDGNTIGKHIEQFLPGATCLSDILAEKGYKNIFINGPALSFAGVGKFLKSHHYAEAYGRKQWLAQGYTKADFNRWGLPDDELFKQAKVKLAALIKEKKPFNLTVLTVDTHGPDGLLSKYCQKQGVNNFEGIVECTANQIADFVTYIKSQGWLDNLNIVIMGDHLAMANSASSKLTQNKYRSIFNMIITKEKLHKNTDEIVNFDMLPTILESLGFYYKGGRLALGYSAIREHRAEHASDRIPDMEKQLVFDSKLYKQFWKSR